MAICPSCKSHDIERVRSKGFMKLVTSVLPVVKWRCRVCHHEFIRIADNIFSVRRVLVWLLLITVGFFVWLMQLDVTQFRQQTNEANNGQEVSLANTSQEGNSTQERTEAVANPEQDDAEKASSQVSDATPSDANASDVAGVDSAEETDNGNFDATVNSYLSDSQMPSDKPGLGLSFIGIGSKTQSATASSVPQPMVVDSSAEPIEETMAESDEIARLTRKIDVLNTENSELKEKVVGLSLDLDSSDKTDVIAKYKEEIGNLKAEITDYETQIANQNTLVDKANTELSTVNELLTSTKLELTTAKEELATKEAEIKVTNNQLTALNESLKEAKETIDSYSAQVTDLTGATTIAKTQYEEAEKTIADQSTTIETMRSKYTELQNEKDVLELKLSKLEAENNELLVAQQATTSQSVIGGDNDPEIINNDSGTNLGQEASVPEASIVADAPEDVASVEDSAEDTMMQAPSQDVAQGQIQQAVEAWRSAWQTKNYDGYFAAYSDNFDAGDGPGVNLDQWRSKRRYIIKRAQSLEIDISEFVSAQVVVDRYIVRFIQKYTSSTYKDEVIKQLVVVYEDGQWKIAKEESL